MVFLHCIVNHIKDRTLACNPNTRLVIFSKTIDNPKNDNIKTDDISRKKPTAIYDNVAISISAQQFFKTFAKLHQINKNATIEENDNSKSNKERAFELKDIMVPCPGNELTWCRIQEENVPRGYLFEGNSKDIIRHGCSYTRNTNITRNLMSFDFDHAILRATLTYAELGFLDKERLPSNHL